MIKLAGIYSYDNKTIRIFNYNGKFWMLVQDLGILCDIKEWKSWSRKFTGVAQNYYRDHLLDLSEVTSKEDYESFAKNFLSSSNKLIFFLDRTGCLTYVNKHARNTTKYLYDRNLKDISDEINRIFDIAAKNANLEEEEEVEVEEEVDVNFDGVVDVLPKDVLGRLNKENVNHYIREYSTNENALDLANQICRATTEIDDRVATLSLAKRTYRMIIERNMKKEEPCYGYFKGFCKFVQIITCTNNVNAANFRMNYELLHSMLTEEQLTEYNNAVRKKLKKNASTTETKPVSTKKITRKTVSKPKKETKPVESVEESSGNPEYDLWLKSFKEYRDQLSRKLGWNHEDTCNYYYQKCYWVVLPSADECRDMGYKNKFEYAYKYFRDETKMMLQTMHKDLLTEDE